MSRSTVWSMFGAAAVVMAAFSHAPAVRAQQRPPAPARDGERREQAGGGDVARGKYIVEDVVQCWRCHSPLNPVTGERDHSRWLMGAPVDIKPTTQVQAQNWAIMAPRIAGAPAGTDDQFVHLMMTGIARTGLPIRQPMLQFHMTEEDARAVLAYVKSLPGGAPVPTR
jgi:mono/diheme cytochrome c family protein